MKSERIVLTGATGLVGKRLFHELRNRGCEISILSRNPGKTRAQFPEAASVHLWAPGLQGDWKNAFEGAAAVIHLAGESIGGERWTAQYKKRIYESRIIGTKEIVSAISMTKQRPSVLISASAIGFYGDCGERDVDESSPPGGDFLAGLCADWEAAALEASSSGVRVVTPRFGVILAKEGGAFERLISPFRFFLGGRVGSGAQWMSWIHIEDVVQLLLLALENESFTGAVNFTTPHPIRNRELARLLGGALHKPSALMIPGPALRIVLGEFAKTLLGGQRVIPRKVLSSGYRFKCETIQITITDILSNS